jgi:hypothetical protein
VNERPILFSGAMVTAILAGTKTMTRRLAKPKTSAGLLATVDGAPVLIDARGAVLSTDVTSGCPYGAPGDRLWVRETHAPGYYATNELPTDTAYRADSIGMRLDEAPNPMRWTPAIHMRRALSRIDLEVTAVRVERLKNITEEDAKAEGVQSDVDALKGLSHIRGANAPRYVPSRIMSARDHFRDLWQSINGKRAPWESNPWVWVVSFKRVRP